MNASDKVLVTGAAGFIGVNLIDHLIDNQILPLAVVRNKMFSWNRPCSVFEINDISANTDWSSVIKKVNSVVHLAARVHIMHERSADPLSAYRAVNVDGTLNLARQAAAAGVKRFIYISSIKVNGEQTAEGHPFRACDLPQPVDFYGISKFEAEEGLLRIGADTKMEIVIIRPVLVYGPEVKGNFSTMISFLQKGLPLPLGAIFNSRSLVSVDNLVDLITTCLNHPAAANQIFLVSDGEDISTTQLLERAALAMGVRPLLFPLPISVIKIAARFLGKNAIVQRLFGSLQVDIEKTRNLLNWNPPYSLEQGLLKAVKGVKR